MLVDAIEPFPLSSLRIGSATHSTVDLEFLLTRSLCDRSGRTVKHPSFGIILRTGTTRWGDLRKSLYDIYW